MPKKLKGTLQPSHHYWNDLRREFLYSNLTLTEFMKYKGITKTKAVFQRATREKWHHEKAALEVEIDKIVQARIVKDGVKEWEEEIRLLKGFRDQVSFVLKKHMDKDGNVTSAIEPTELKALAEVVTKNVVARKHIKGEPVGEDGAKPGDTHLHLHAYAVQVVNEIEADGDGPTPLTPPHLDHKSGG